MKYMKTIIETAQQRLDEAQKDLDMAKEGKNRFTLENLERDGACKNGIDFIRPHLVDHETAVKALMRGARDGQCYKGDTILDYLKWAIAHRYTSVLDSILGTWWEYRDSGWMYVRTREFEIDEHGALVSSVGHLGAVFEPDDWKPISNPTVRE